MFNKSSMHFDFVIKNVWSLNVEIPVYKEDLKQTNVNSVVHLIYVLSKSCLWTLETVSVHFNPMIHSNVSHTWHSNGEIDCRMIIANGKSNDKLINGHLLEAKWTVPSAVNNGRTDETLSGEVDLLIGRGVPSLF